MHATLTLLACLSTSQPQAEAAKGPVTAPSASALLEDERNTIAVFESAAPSTVFVTQSQLVRPWGSSTSVEVAAGSGSGVVWDRDGHIVTNYHVVRGASSLSVTLHDGSTWPAKLVGKEPRKDLAVLQIEAPSKQLKAIALPPENQALLVGQKVLAIGNPYGLDHTLTTGVVSALGREIQGFGGVSIRDVVQTDASINPGNSGGPLLDSQGRLVGINSQIASASGASAGIGFAVPVDTVRTVVADLIEYGHVQQAGLGVVLVDDRVARRAGIQKGVVLRSVAPGSPAHKAGLVGLQDEGRKPGDILVGIGAVEIVDYDDLYNALDDYKPGDQVQLTVLRDGERREVTLTLILLE